ncbi:hypothetical protein [Streptomyces sp. NPDC055287]
MAKTARRRISRIAGASCLAAALAFPIGMSTAVAAPDVVAQATTAGAPDPPDPPDPPPQEEQQDPPPQEEQQDPPPQEEQQDPPPQEEQQQEEDTPQQEQQDQQEDPPQEEQEQQQQQQQQQRQGITEEKQKAVEQQVENAPEDVKASLDTVLTDTLKVINNPATSAADKALYTGVVNQLSVTLNLIDSPNTSAEDKATYTKAVAGMAEALKLSQDAKRSAVDRAAYRDIAQSLSFFSFVVQEPTTPPESKAFFRANLELLSDALVALSKPKPAEPKEGEKKPEEKKPEEKKEEEKKVETGVKKTTEAMKAIQNPRTKPKDPQDQEKIQQVVEKNSQALVTVQDPNASEDERNDAQATVDQLDGATQNSQFLELMEEVKRLGAPSACVEKIESRTSEAGWPDGSLWGLSDPSCADTVSAGASEGGKWGPMFECVSSKPFSECAGTIPKED